MEKVQDGLLPRVFHNVAVLGNGLHHFPFAELRGRRARKFGSLRLWIKKKSFDVWDKKEDGGDEMKGEDLKWRPLVSFREHRWRKLLSMVSRW